ncbi:MULTISPECIES: SWIM zinc finger family protein [unclassified Streptomyces]|uniref:SWIM zinc finger family protein n=1 Tax=unclassified Streptomyces TaxID=2593676 RepID=UPI00404128B3
MTPEDESPAAAARRALRAARERTRAEREGAQGAPAERAEAERGEGAAVVRPAAPGANGTFEKDTPRTGPAEEQDAAEKDAAQKEGAETGAVGAGGTPGTRAAGTGTPGTGAARPQARPADVAREALRAARRQAASAGGEDAARERTGAAEPRARRGPGSEPGSARAARLKAIQDMRRYLETAFRMPAWSDTEEEQHPETAGTTDTADTRDPVPAEASPQAPQTSQTPRTVSARPDRTPVERTSPRTDQDPTTPHTTNPDSASAPRPEPAPHPATPLHTPAPAPAPAASSPHLPTTMATPHRDGELRRTFPEFGPREATAEGAPFAATWWGNAWVDALQQGALDPKRLVRGRGYADQGHVDAITVTPGLVLAYVRGSRPRPYRVQVRVRTLDDEDWARFLDAAADRPGHIAALLDKELPQSLADCGVPLLPGPGDLVSRCSCPDSGHPCKHAAALCYQTARLLDADPFVLLLLRGRGERSLLDALSRRSAARAARAARDRQPETLPGVRATDALAPRERPPLPPPLPAPPHPEQPPVYPAAPGGPDPFALDQLATDAAARAHALLTTGRDPVGELTLWQDAVRLAAARPGSGLTAATRALYAALAAAVGRTPADLARAVAAWRQGGPDGLAVLEEPWDPPAGRFDRARPLLLAADLPAFRPWRNRLTHPRGHVQLRLGRDGLWYAYESEPGRDDWWPRGTPDLDPVGALTGLGTPDDV